MFQLKNRRSFSRAQRRILTVDKPRPALPVEALENRLLLSGVNSWKAPVSGTWETPSNWSLGHVPTASEDAVISVAGAYTVTLNPFGNESVHSLMSSKPVVLASGSLTVATTVTMTNSLTLSSGKLIGATLVFGSGGSLLGSGGALDNITLGSNLTVPDQADFNVYDTLNLGGHVLTLSPTNYDYLYFYYNSTTSTGPTLTNGTLNLGSTGNGQLLDYSSPKPLTITSSAIVEGSGYITVAYPSPAGLAFSGKIDGNVSGKTLTISGGGGFTNKGTISATGGGIVTFSGAWINAGVINENAGTLNLGGTFTSTGSITRTGGVINLTGTYNLGGGVLSFTPTTGSWNMTSGGELLNGTLTVAGGASLLITGGALDNITLGSNLTVPDQADFSVYDTLNLGGHVLTLSPTNYDYVYFYDNSTTSAGPTLTNGTLNLGSTGNGQLLDYSSPKPMTITSSAIVEGSGYITVAYPSPAGLAFSGKIDGNVSGKTLSISGGGGFTNKGTVSATGGGIVTFSGAWINAGVISENAGTLNLGGTFTSTGSITRTGGVINLTGTYNLGGGVLSFTPTTGSWNMTTGGELLNGTLTVAGGASLLIIGGALDNITLGSNLTVPDQADFNVYDTLNLGGHVLTLSPTNYDYLYFYDNSTTSTGPTLTNGTLNLGSTGNGQLLDYSSPKPLTITSSAIVEGSGYITVAYPSPAGLAFSGKIDGNVSGKTLSISGGGGFTNKGTVSATGGGIVTFSGAWINAGVINENAGTLNLGGTFTSTGSITRTGGVINLTGTYNLGGGVLSFTPTTGSWNMTTGGELLNGTLTVAGGASLLITGGALDNITLGSNLTVPDQADFNVYDTLNLGGHVLTLSPTNYDYVYFYDNSTTSTGPTLTNGTLNLGSTGNGQLLDYSSPKPLTITSSAIVEGSGYITVAYPSPAGLNNYGTILANVAGKPLTLSAGGAFNNRGMINAATGATISITGAAFSNAGGILTGTGTITTLSGSGTLTNDGTIDAGSPFGKLTITGNLTETATGVIHVALGGTAATSFNTLTVSGKVILAGLLDVYLVGGFKPAIGNSFRVLSDASQSGAVSSDGTSLGGGVALSVLTGGNNITLKAISMPADTTAPTAGGFKAGPISSGATLFTFTVTYSDNVAIDLSTLGNGNITVSHGGVTIAATFVSVNKANNGSPRTVTYSIIPPGGKWSKADNGSYTVTLKPASVKDTHGNAVAGQVLGNFMVSLAV